MITNHTLRLSLQTLDSITHPVTEDVAKQSESSASDKYVGSLSVVEASSALANWPAVAFRGLPISLMQGQSGKGPSRGRDMRFVTEAQTKVDMIGLFAKATNSVVFTFFNVPEFRMSDLDNTPVPLCVERLLSKLSLHSVSLDDRWHVFGHRPSMFERCPGMVKHELAYPDLINDLQAMVAHCLPRQGHDCERGLIRVRSFSLQFMMRTRGDELSNEMTSTSCSAYLSATVYDDASDYVSLIAGSLPFLLPLPAGQLNRPKTTVCTASMNALLSFLNPQKADAYPLSLIMHTALNEYIASPHIHDSLQKHVHDIGMKMFDVGQYQWADAAAAAKLAHPMELHMLQSIVSMVHILWQQSLSASFTPDLKHAARVERDQRLFNDLVMNMLDLLHSLGSYSDHELDAMYSKLIKAGF